MVEYKLYYFDVRGLAEVVRLVFAATGQKYEDVRFTRDKWPELKPKAPFGKAPFLEITDGSKTFTISQSKTIARYLSRKFDMAGKDDDESALIDM
jgi:glutathione S-transferase